MALMPVEPRLIPHPLPPPSTPSLTPSPLTHLLSTYQHTPSQHHHPTTIGEKMALMPVEPRLAKCLLASFDFGCSEEILSIAAMCTVEYPFIHVKGGKSSGAVEAKQRLLDCIGEFATLEGCNTPLL